MVYFSSSIQLPLKDKENKMFKSILAPALVAVSLASPASAQYIEPGSIQAHAYGSGMYQRQVETARAMYYYGTGYDGLAPSWQNPNARMVVCPQGGGLLSEGYLLSLRNPGFSPTDPYIAGIGGPGGGCFPGGGGYGNVGWGVGVNAGVGGSFGGGWGGGGNYNYNNTSWGVGVNAGVGGSFGGFNNGFGGGGFNNTGWGIGINGGVGGNSGSFRSW